MMRATSVELTPDAVLIASARTGDMHAFGQLWERHQTAAVRFSARLVRESEAEDLVSEAFANIHQTLRNGAGPDEMFRPYLYVTLKNLAMRWSVRDAAGRVDDEFDLDQLVDPMNIEDATIDAFDRSVVATAFRSLPTRWQEVLWYTEVESLKPHEVAPILGMTANAVAALSYRARDGFRRLWVEQQSRDTSIPLECRDAGRQLADPAELSADAAAHIARCRRCSALAAQGADVSLRLRSVLVPLLLGGGAGGLLLQTLAAQAAEAALVSLVLPGASAGATTILTAAHLPQAVAVVLAIATATTLGIASLTAPPSATAWGLPATTAGESSATDEAGSPVTQGNHQFVPGDGEPTVFPPARPTNPYLPTVPSPTQPPPTNGAPSPFPEPSLPPTKAPPVTPPPTTPPALDASAPPAPSITTTFPAGLTAAPPIAGTGEPGSRVQVVADGTPLADVPVDGQGYWSAGVLPLQPYTRDITITQTDAAGNRSVPLVIQPLFQLAIAPGTPSSVQQNTVASIDATGWLGATYQVFINGRYWTQKTITSARTTLVAGFFLEETYDIQFGYVDPVTGEMPYPAHFIVTGTP